jgi:predicted enzyme related to lactoylglutathione lyase
MSATAMNRIYAKLPARDVERARAFYADKLGLRPARTPHICRGSTARNRQSGRSDPKGA